MALKFVDAPPTATRGGGGNRIMTDDVVEELKAHPNKWAVVAEGVTSAQSIAKWVNNNAGFEYTSRNTGKTVKNRNNKEVPTFDVYVCFKP